MEIPEQAKGYLQGIGYIIMFSIIMWIISKQRDPTCDDFAGYFRDDFGCSIILTDKDDSWGIVTLSGINLYNKLPDKCRDGSKWISHHLKQFNIGDTVIKNKGEYTITIKRKNKSILIPFKCGDKIYQDTVHHK